MCTAQDINRGQGLSMHFSESLCLSVSNSVHDDVHCIPLNCLRELTLEPEVGAFYWTVLAPDIVNPEREEQSSVSM